MYWKIKSETKDAASEAAAQGRFVLHRHTDAKGAHLDLRLEENGFLGGFRIEADSLKQECGATEKAPHPLRWLEADGDAIREDAGNYCWLRRSGEEDTLELRGAQGVRVLHLNKTAFPSEEAAQAIAQCCRTLNVAVEEAPQLLRDGASARARACERFCALGRELDGAAFVETVWRKTLRGLSLDEIHDHLRSYEVRFDLKYPPQPVSVAEALPEEAGFATTRGDRNIQVLEIARG